MGFVPVHRKHWATVKGTSVTQMLVEMAKWTLKLENRAYVQEQKTQTIALCYTFIILGNKNHREGKIQI